MNIVGLQLILQLDCDWLTKTTLLTTHKWKVCFHFPLLFLIEILLTNDGPSLSGGLDYWTHGKCLWTIKEQNFKTPKSLATLPSVLQVVQFIQGQLRYVDRQASVIAIAV